MLKATRLARRELNLAYHRKYNTDKKAEVLISEARRRSLKKMLPFDLDQHVPELKARIVAATCEMTGLPLNLSNRGIDWNSPSMDRIEPAKGYVLANIRIVCFAINQAMGRWGEAKLREIMTVWLERK